MSARTSATRIDRDAYASGLDACDPAGETRFVAEEERWAHKRENKRQDLEQLKAGLATEHQMSWFSGGRARGCRLLNSPY